MEDRRAVDQIEFKRVNDEDCNADAEISSHKMLYAIYKDVQELKVKLHNMEEMFEMWTNTKGFVTTVRVAGRVVLWIGSIGAVIAGMWYAFKKAITGL